LTVRHHGEVLSSKNFLAIKPLPCHTRFPKLAASLSALSAGLVPQFISLGESNEKLIETESVVGIVLALRAALGSFADDSVCTNLALNRGGKRTYACATSRPIFGRSF
jgi:hypothetical protein